MALESEPLIAEIEEVPMTVAPIASAKAPLKKTSQVSKKDKSAKASVKKPHRSKEKSANKLPEIASASNRPPKASSVRRRSISSSPLKRQRIDMDVENESKRQRIDMEAEYESVTEDQIDDPTLNVDGFPARAAQDILPDEQSTDFVKDTQYPLTTTLDTKLRSLERDINNTISLRDDFAQFDDTDIIKTARLFWKCGLTSTEELKKTRQLNRSFMLEDLRKEGITAKDLNLFTGLLHLFPPPAQTQPGKKGNFVECCIPRLLPKLSANLSRLNPLLVPDQVMVNEISRQLGEGDLCHPSYTAFPIAQLKDEPWKPALATHDRAAEEWKNRMTGMRSDQTISFQAYSLYLLRFIFAAHMVSAWEPFGGISAQLNAMAVFLNISIVENSGIAIAYDIAIRKHCATLARQRGSDINYFRLLSEECQEVKRQVYSARYQHPPAQEKGKGKGKGKKGQGLGKGKGQEKGKNSFKRTERSEKRSPNRSRRRSRSRKRSRSRRSRKSRSKKPAQHTQNDYKKAQKKKSNK